MLSVHKGLISEEQFWSKSDEVIDSKVIESVPRSRGW